MPTPPRVVSPVRLCAAVAGLSAALFLAALPTAPAAAAEVAALAQATGVTGSTGWPTGPAGAGAEAGVADAADATGAAGATGGTVSPGIGGYTGPAFGDACTFHRYGEGETPPFRLIGTDPVCVEYAKRDITLSNGGALRFLLAEPARFALAVPACRYWQLDHWSVQTHPGGPTLVGWDGSYWFDQSTGEAALKARDITVAGIPATGEEAADALRPYDPALADALQRASLGVKAELPLSLSCSWRTR
ncbi:MULTISPECIES: hypothetical protein [Streptomyces]|uniref:Uncharacterized protein n=2 Tax=Streptomyces TaxID=1883 RepID=A0A3M8EZQ7_9ACTN|nr:MULTISPECIES: hypothetical protein [Streptomyces]KNE81935.1 hypothetical protein ADZ36_13685 [Streptomyces fradiae]OFA51552.1 hypothetical protein BEN35_13375 [Streptomyces fradiae]PQM20740.1 hypothetical protein Sfr7A_24210 [Streptomyces xinghaiensis]RKM95941.1 hypothetical protein SFRA_013110 [Streptomyces xinghaiensis]RNC70922.1 hypothetical protein DC095_024885 [Streptomyces xinghaiensis]